jgi:hypothetical protein
VDPASIIESLEAGSFDQLIGAVETGAVDFKGEPYQLDTAYGKYELAKDVAAFASSTDDAVIVFPIETERSDDSPFERAKRVRPIAMGLVDEKRYRAVIRSNIYPSPRNVAIDFYGSHADDEVGVWAIRISAQREEDKPFLVVGPLAPDGARVQGWLVGFPTRTLDETEHLRPAQVHELISRGRTVGTQLNELMIRLAHLDLGTVEYRQPDNQGGAATPTVEASSPDRVKEHALAAVVHVGFERDEQGGSVEFPTLYLAGGPSTEVTVPTLFTRDGVRHLLENPPVTRYDGWNLSTLNRAEIVNGTQIRLESGRRKLVELHEDGTLVAIARFDRLLVARTLEAVDGIGGPLMKVNPLGLIEFVHDFVLVYRALIEFLEPQPESIQFAFGVRAALRPTQTGRLFLPPGPVGSFGWEMPDEEVPPDVDSYDSTMTVATSDLQPGTVAARIVTRLYPYFKRELDQIPYLNDARDAVEPEKFGKP